MNSSNICSKVTDEFSIKNIDMLLFSEVYESAQCHTLVAKIYVNRSLISVQAHLVMSYSWHFV